MSRPIAYEFIGRLHWPSELTQEQKTRARALYATPVETESAAHQVTRVALRQLWETLGVDNQTAATIKLRNLVEADKRKSSMAFVPDELAKRCEEGYRQGLSSMAYRIGFIAAETTGKTLSDAQEQLRRALDISMKGRNDAEL